MEIILCSSTAIFSLYHVWHILWEFQPQDTPDEEILKTCRHSLICFLISDREFTEGLMNKEINWKGGIYIPKSQFFTCVAMFLSILQNFQLRRQNYMLKVYQFLQKYINVYSSAFTIPILGKKIAYHKASHVKPLF